MKDIHFVLLLPFIIALFFLFYRIAQKSSSKFSQGIIVGKDWNEKIKVIRNVQNVKDTRNVYNIYSLCDNTDLSSNKRIRNLTKRLNLDAILQDYEEINVGTFSVKNNGNELFSLIELESISNLSNLFDSCFISNESSTLYDYNMGIQKMCLVLKGEVIFDIEDKSINYTKGSCFSWDPIIPSEIKTDEMTSAYIIFTIPRSLGAYEDINLELLKKEGSKTNTQTLNNDYIVEKYYTSK